MTHSTTITFHATGPFKAFAEAQEYCRQKGLSVGSMQRDAPIGLRYGDANIAKWQNLSDEDIDNLDGFISGDTRNGPVTVHHH